MNRPKKFSYLSSLRVYVDCTFVTKANLRPVCSNGALFGVADTKTSLRYCWIGRLLCCSRMCRGGPPTSFLHDMLLPSYQRIEATYKSNGIIGIDKPEDPFTNFDTRS